MNLAKLKGTIELDVRRFRSALKSVDVSTEKVFGGIRRRIKQVKADFKNELGKGLAIGFGATAATRGLELVGAGIQAVTDFIGTSIKAASDLRETVSKSSVVFGQYAGEVEAWAATAAEAFGQSKRAALDAASGFAGLFSTVGIELEQSTGMARKLTELGSDLASFFNTDVGSALEALRSGLSGESEPLRRFNVFLSETAVTAKLTQMGVKKVGGTFTESQKATARYKLILEQTSAAQGDFARTADGLANSQRKADARLENAQAALGEAFLPIALQVTQWQLDFIEGAGLVGDALGGIDRGVRGAQLGIRTFLADAGDFLAFWDGFTTETEDAAIRSARSTAVIAAAMTTRTAEMLDYNRPVVAAAAARVAGAVPQAFRLAIVATKVVAATALVEIASSLREGRAGWQGALDQLGQDLEVRMSAAAEVAKLKSALAGDNVRKGLKSRDPIVKAQAQATVALIREQLLTLGSKSTTWGENAGANFARGLRSTAEQVRAAAAYLAKAAAANLEVRSPAKEGPLSRGGPEAWGKRFGILWASGADASIGRIAAAAGRMAGAAVPPVGTMSGGWQVAAGAGDGMAGAGPGSAGSGGDTNIYITNPEPRAADDDIGRVLRRLEGLGMTGARGCSPA